MRDWVVQGAPVTQTLSGYLHCPDISVPDLAFNWGLQKNAQVVEAQYVG